MSSHTESTHVNGTAVHGNSIKIGHITATEPRALAHSVREVPLGITLMDATGAETLVETTPMMTAEEAHQEEITREGITQVEDTLEVEAEDRPEADRQEVDPQAVGQDVFQIPTGAMSTHHVGKTAIPHGEVEVCSVRTLSEMMTAPTNVNEGDGTQSCKDPGKTNCQVNRRPNLMGKASHSRVS